MAIANKGKTDLSFSVDDSDTSTDDDTTEVDEEDKGSWERLLFLPFSSLWTISLLITTNMHCFYVMYHILFTSEREILTLDWGTHLPFFEYPCEIFFIIDWILSAIYKNCTALRSVSLNAPRRTIFLTLGFMSMLPIDKIYYVYNRSSVNVKTLYCLKLNHILRLYRTLKYFYEVRNSACRMNIASCVIELSIYLLWIAHICSGILYHISCMDINDPKCSRSWSVLIRNDTGLVLKWDYEWYMLCYHVILGRLTSKGSHNIESHDTIVLTLFTFCCFLYLLALVGFIISQFTTVIIRAKRSTFLFSHKLHIIKRQLQYTNVNKDIYNDIMDYYGAFWTRRSGVSEKQPYKILPIVTRRELCLDVYWDALKHSHLFRDMDVAFLRVIAQHMHNIAQHCTTLHNIAQHCTIYAQHMHNICTTLHNICTTLHNIAQHCTTYAQHMKSEFLLRGHVVFNKNCREDKMIYIVYGAVQILSYVDDETPIMSLSAGTCLGEASLLFGFVNRNIVECVSNCEISFLERQTFYDIMLKYPTQQRIFRRMIEERITKAHELSYVTSLLEKDIVEFVDKPLTTQLKWVRNTLLRLMQKSKKCLKGNNDSEMTNNIIPFDGIQFTAKYLDMCVLSEEFELITDAICLQTTCPWILEPNSVLIKGWLYTMAFVVTILALILPYYAVFECRFPQVLFMGIYICQIIYMIDLWIQITTAVATRHGVVTDWREIFVIRLTEPGFIADILATIPFYLLANLVEGSNNQLCIISSLTLLLKLWKVALIFNKLENSLTVNVSVIQLIKYTSYISYAIYFSSAVLYAESCYNNECDPRGWVLNPVNEITRIEDRYKLVGWALYLSTVSLTGIGYGDIQPSTLLDFICISILYFIGCLLFMYIIADLSATNILTRKKTNKYQETIKSVRQFMFEKNLHADIQERVLDYLSTIWMHNEGATVIFGRTIVFDIPAQIYKEMQVSTLFSLLYQVPLFQNFSDDFINRVALVTYMYILPSNEIVTYSGEVAKEMHILERGYCEIVIIENGKPKKVVMGPGSQFSVVEMCLGIPVVNTVKTITHCKIYTVQHTDLSNIMNEFPLLAEEYYEARTGFMHLKGMFEFKDGAKYIDIMTTNSKELQTSWKYFGYILTKGSPEEKDYNIPFEELKNMAFIKFFLLRLTFHPHGKFIIYWEIIRAFFAFVTSIIIPAFAVILTHYSLNVCNTLKWTLDVMAYADIYVRLHLAYYNEKGILVTHPLKTAKHYITHALFIDILACLPFDLLLRLRGEGVLSMFSRILFLSRLLQCYRIIRGATFIETNVLRQSSIMSVIKFAVITVIACNAIGSLIVMSTCEFMEPSSAHSNPDIYLPGVNCYRDTWIGRSKYTKPLNAMRVYLYGVYWALSTLTRVGNSITCQDLEEGIYTILLAIFGIVGTMYIYASIVASRSCRNVDLTSYQDNLKCLVEFMNSTRIQNKLRNQVIKHFELIWARKPGKTAHTMFETFHSALKEDILFDIFGKSVTQCPAFKNAKRSFFRNLLLRADLKIFINKGRIVTVNDVHNKIYFVHKGMVDVYGPDRCQICSLFVGSVFGNLDNTAMTRQAITFVGNGHVELLEMSTVTFYQVLGGYPRVKRTFELLTFVHVDYISGTTDAKDEIVLKEIDPKLINSNEGKTGVMRLIPSIFRKVYSPYSKYLKIWEISFLLGSLFSCIITSYQLSMQEFYTQLFVIAYFLDALYLLKIYLRFHLAYEDEFGEVTDLKRISRIYRHSYTGFYFDLASAVPLDLIALCLGQYSWVTILRINRLIRALYVFRYFQVSRNRLNINVYTMRLGFIATWIIFIIHYMSCLLGMAIQYAEHGSLYEGMSAKRKFKYYVTNISNVIHMFTSTSLESITANSLTLELCFIFVILFGQVVTAVFMGETCAVLEMVKFTMSRYAHNIDILKEYMKLHGVSPTLLSEVWTYVCFLWNNQRGTQYPELLDDAPYYLREGIKNSLYGHRIQGNILFSDCHYDFVRQLTSTLKPCTFVPAQIILYEGCSNNCMYFIHSGEIEVITEGELYSEEIHDVVKEGEAFGTVQGVYPDTPHNFTYRSKTVSMVLVLNYDDWNHLLDYFPTDKEIIYDKARALLLTE